MPNVGPACVGIALVAFDSKQLKPFLWLLLTEGNPVGLCGFGQSKVTRRFMAEALGV
jgi:hypothetical protein